MRRLFLLACIVAAAQGQQCSEQDSGCANKYSEKANQHVLSTDEPQANKYSAKFKNLMTSMLSFNPTVNAPGKCGEHSRIARDAANQLELWALQMFDSSGRVSHSLLNGNVNQYGDFDQCLNIEHSLGDSGEIIKGQYVLAFFDLQVNAKVNDPQLKHMLALAHSYDVIRSNFSDPGHRVPRYSTINWGICVPASCKAKDVEKGLKEALQPLSTVPEFSLALQVDDAMMYTKEPFDPDLMTWLVILLFASLFACAILATLVDMPGKQLRPLSKRKRVFLAFSLRRTYGELMNIKSAADDISSLHGLRFLNAVGLLICHKSMALFFYPYINRTEMTMRLEKPWTVIGRTAILYTDTFIVFSGLLVAYSFIKDLDKRGEIGIKSKLKARFLRITPNFAAIILFCTYILQLMGSGPQWNLVVKHYADLCKNHMWKNFLYIHNYFGFENMCLTHTHQLGIDMQLFVVSPILVYLAWKWPRGGSFCLVALAGLSTWLRYTVTYNNELSSIIYFGNTIKKMFDTCNLSYILPSHRLTVYIMGILAGVYLRRNPNGINLNLFTTLLAWVLAGLVCIYPWFSPYNMSRHNYVYDVVEASRYAAYAPILWSLFMISLIFLCHQDRGSFLGSFMRWKGFQVFTKISYAVYLTQFPIFFYNVGTTRFSGYSVFGDLFVVSEVLVVVIASVILTLLVDLPFQEIKKIVTEQEISGTKGNLGKQELNGKTRRSTSAIEITGDTRRNDSETTRVLRRSHTIANGKS